MVHKSLFLLGRQPAIGRAELESVFGIEHLQAVGDQAVACSFAPRDIAFMRFGGSVRLAEIIAILDTTTWVELERLGKRHLSELLHTVATEGKIKLGLSVFGFDIQPRQLLRTGLELKKICKQAGRSARIVPNETATLSSAQALHNQLTGELGIELLFVKHQNRTYLARTVHVQNITAYAKRDQGRPKRDARVGMLPPKLAQIIINLAAGSRQPTASTTILDPFCGTGVVLQEALLMGFSVYGTDLEPRMIDFTSTNLEWLRSTSTLIKTHPTLEVGDATTKEWRNPVDIVACETYLGRPLTHWPNPETLTDIIGACNAITERFLENIHPQLAPGTRLCLAIPAWKGAQGHTYHLPLLDHLGQIGYNRVRFELSSDKDLVYFRPEQIVARQLLVITRK